MQKNLITILLSASLIFSLIAFPCNAQEEKVITFESFETFMYPSRRPFKTPYTSESKVDNVIPLDESENTITLTLDEANENDLYFVSLYIMDEENGHRYLTPPCGIIFNGKKVTLTGLSGEMNYRLMISSFSQNQIISGTIKTGYIE